MRSGDERLESLVVYLYKGMRSIDASKIRSTAHVVECVAMGSKSLFDFQMSSFTFCRAISHTQIFELHGFQFSTASES